MTDASALPPIPKRRPISKRMRFEIFKRDEFACQYCGQTPPAVVLEIDHIVAVISGGSSERHNLITSCFDCNRGKGAVALSSPAKTEVIEAMEISCSKVPSERAFKYFCGVCWRKIEQ